MQRTPNTPNGSLATQASPNPDRSLVLSYIGLRRSIGIIGLALPFVLAFGKILLESPGLLPSISAYYYSVMRDVFVGAMCATGVFLLSYRYSRLDDIAGDIAGIAAFGIAFFPGEPAKGATEQQMIIGKVHLGFAAVFFLTLAFFALVLFQRLDWNKQLTPEKLQRNGVYRASGIAMLVFFALMLVDLLFLQDNQGFQSLNPGFWLESLAIFAFGIAWFVKGETLMKDQ